MLSWTKILALLLLVIASGPADLPAVEKLDQRWLYLQTNLRQCVATLHKVNPTAKLCVWSDMFDPHHNAVKNFYLVNGDLAGSWEGLPAGMIIVNWNHDQAKQSLPWFSQRGHSQVLAGYYDHDAAKITGWLGTGLETKSTVSGAMYTTWQNDFSQLEAFAQHAWGK